MNHDIHRVAVFGLGKLGAPLVAVLASKGFQVVGVDRDPAKLALLAAGQPPVDEPGLPGLLVANMDRIEATDDVERAVQKTQAAFIVVPTPSLPDGRYSLEAVLEVGREIGQALQSREGYYLVVLVSTVMPGDTARLCECLEQASGGPCGFDFGVCYSPEFIAIGSVIDDLQRPDFVLIGQEHCVARAALNAIYLQLVPEGTPLAVMNYVSAEVAKLALNCYVTGKISFANALGMLCHDLPGADARAICDAIGLDSRIGSKYLRPGTPFGGPCFPRDGRALRRLAGQSPVAGFSSAVDAINRATHQFLCLLVETACGDEKGPVAVLGLAYKPGTSLAEESAGLNLALDLAQSGYALHLYDPAAIEDAKARWPEDVPVPLWAASLGEALAGAAVAIVMTPWPEFQRRPIIGPRTVIDPWSCVEDPFSIATDA